MQKKPWSTDKIMFLIVIAEIIFLIIGLVADSEGMGVAGTAFALLFITPIVWIVLRAIDRKSQK